MESWLSPLWITLFHKQIFSEFWKPSGVLCTGCLNPMYPLGSALNSLTGGEYTSWLENIRHRINKVDTPISRYSKVLPDAVMCSVIWEYLKEFRLVIMPPPLATMVSYNERGGQEQGWPRNHLREKEGMKEERERYSPSHVELLLYGETSELTLVLSIATPIENDHWGGEGEGKEAISQGTETLN